MLTPSDTKRYLFYFMMSNILDEMSEEVNISLTADGKIPEDLYETQKFKHVFCNLKITLLAPIQIAAIF